MAIQRKRKQQPRVPQNRMEALTTSALRQIEMYAQRNLSKSEQSRMSQVFLAGKSPPERELILKLWAAFRDQRRKEKKTEEKLHLVFDAQGQWENIYTRQPDVKKMIVATRKFFVKTDRLPTIAELIQLTTLSRKQLSLIIGKLYRDSFVKSRRASSSRGRKTKSLPRYRND